MSEKAGADPDEAARLQADFSELLNPAEVVVDSKLELSQEVDRLTNHLEEMARIARSALSERALVSRTGAELEASLLAELQRTFAKLDRIAAHIRAVDAAVAAMEAAVTEQTRQSTLVSIKNTFSPISRLFGVEPSSAVAPFVRPPQSRFDPL